MKQPCHECQSDDVIVFDEYTALPRVTSDCKPWPRGGELQLCRRCGLLQSSVTPEWLDEIARIYADYDCHYQSGGIDQAVYDPASGQPIKRADKLLMTLAAANLLPTPASKLVDVGCGSGAFLAACGRHLPRWQLVGLDQTDKFESAIRALPGVVGFQQGQLDQLEGIFGVVTLIHVLEHIVAPSASLAALSRRLHPDGVFFIQVPSYESNPFELVVADHASHLDGPQLQRLIKAAGSRPLNDDLDWLPKELSLVASTCSGSPEREPPSASDIAATESSVRKRLRWLTSVAAMARNLVGRKPFGVFGTSIAANWLLGVIGESAVDFFVDEDPARRGLQHCGRPVVTPAEIPEGATVFVPLAPGVAQQVRSRLESSRYTLVVPEF
jgi:SAM-dependent methyltransferase